MYIKGNYIKHFYIISYVPPYIVQQPLSGIVSKDNSFTFTIKAKGTKNLVYKWYKNNLPIQSANQNTYSILSAAKSDQGYYYCQVSNNAGLVQSISVPLSVASNLDIVTQPNSLIINPNTNSNFNISATGTEPIKYQWYKDGVLIPSATDRVLYITNANNTNEGNYYCYISNIIDSTSSNVVGLTLNKPISILSIPPSVICNPNQVINTYLSCIGTFPIHARWRKNGINYQSEQITSTGNIFFYNPNLTVSDEGTYDCVLTNIVGSVTSNSFSIYVNKPLGFITQPISGNANIGSSYTFTAEASGTNPITYKWIKTNPYVDLGVTNKILKINNIEVDNQANYFCVATNMVNSVTSNTVTLSVNSNYLLARNGDYILLDTNTYWQLN